MSKVEVKVKKGDGFATRSGHLYQLRGAQCREVANSNGVLACSAWADIADTENGGADMRVLNRPAVVKAWIEDAGGTVVEEREEAAPYTKTLHVYEYDGSVALCYKRSDNFTSWRYVGTTTITIAGVTT